MKALTISKWGNSTAVRIPKSILIKFNLSEGDALRFVPSNSSQLVFEPVRQESKKPVRGRYRLQELMPKGSLAKLEDWDEMPSVGREIEL